MKALQEIRKELTDAFDSKDLKVDGNLLSESPHFEDYVRMGHYLSAGAQTTIKGVPTIQNALIALEADVTKRIGAFWYPQTNAIKHFNQQKAAYEGKGVQPAKDKDFSRLLTAALNEFERKHGFVVVGAKLPNYAGFVFGNGFKESLAQKQHWKDVGAGAGHGEYSHRIQWFVMISAGVIQTVPPFQEATVFASIAPWQKGKTNLWTFLFDLLVTDTSIGADKLDFRSPENLNTWLVSDATPEFCPVLRAFLRARMAKRQASNDMEKYLAKKLGKSAEEAAIIMDSMREDMALKRNPSARIAYPKNAAPEYSPYVKT